MRKQTGFTLIEIAIVLVIIGLLLGGVLKGQELIQSARVRNLASMQDGVKAAFFGFQDRFRALPGDYTLASTNIANVAATSNGNGNGMIRVITAGAETIDENIAAWEHLSKSGFINGSYTYAAGTETATTAPVNAYNITVRLIFDGVYGITSLGTVRHNVKTGPGIPVAVIAELDRKIDDGLPYTGTFQFSLYVGNGVVPTEGAAGTCTSGNTAAATWLATNGLTNCGGATLL